MSTYYYLSCASFNPILSLLTKFKMDEVRHVCISCASLMAGIKPPAGKQEVNLSGRKAHLTALMTALSGADRSSTVISQWQPRSSRESSVVMPASTEEETQRFFFFFFQFKQCTNTVQWEKYSVLKVRVFKLQRQDVQECFRGTQLWLSGGENLCPPWIRSLRTSSFFGFFYCQLSRSM